MLAFRDFHPAVLQAPGIFSAGAYEDIAGIVRTADQWVKDSGIRPLNVETLVLPSLIAGISGASAIRVGPNAEVIWVQVVRVWYETK